MNIIRWLLTMNIKRNIWALSLSGHCILIFLVSEIQYRKKLFIIINNTIVSYYETFYFLIINNNASHRELSLYLVIAKIIIYDLLLFIGLSLTPLSSLIAQFWLRSRVVS